MSSLIVEVVRVGELEKHPNADTLWIATVKGWKCIVKENQFRPGDLAVYIPIDSVLPQSLIDEHQLTYLKKGDRVRTVKLRGCVSQGLLLNLPEGCNWREGMNVAEAMGITKWEPPAPPIQGISRPSTFKNPNPYFSKYTDIENWKNFPDVFQPMDDVVITEKVHGTNFRAGWVPAHPQTWWQRLLFRLGRQWEFVVGSHNVQIWAGTRQQQFYDNNVYLRMAHKYKLARALPKGYVIYGEIYGDGIQDLTYGCKEGEIDAVFFDVKKNDRYLSWDEFSAFCDARLLDTAPVLYAGKLEDAPADLCAEGGSVVAGWRDHEQMREGSVVKMAVETNDNRIGRKILKCVSTEYLLRKNGTENH